MLKKNSVIILTLCMIAAMPAFALRPADEHPSIVDEVISAGNIELIQEDDILKLLEWMEEKKVDRGNDRIGYRVQVFFDNNQRTARNEVRQRQSAIKSRFPQYDSYVSYKQPYWRLVVGDFRKQEEANELMRKLQAAFPAYAREMHVVRDIIKNLPAE